MAGQSVLDVLDWLNLGLRRPRHFYMTGLRPPPKAETTSRVFLRFVVLVVLLIAVAAAIWTTVTLDRIELIEDVALEDLEHDTWQQRATRCSTWSERVKGLFLSCCSTMSMWLEGSSGTEWWHSSTPGFQWCGSTFPDSASARGSPRREADTLWPPWRRKLRDAIRQSFNQPAVVVGVGLGGEVAAEIAVTQPDLLAGLVMVDVDFYLPRDWDEFVERLPWFGTAATYALETGGPSPTGAGRRTAKAVDGARRGSDRGAISPRRSSTPPSRFTSSGGPRRLPRCRRSWGRSCDADPLSLEPGWGCSRRIGRPDAGGHARGNGRSGGRRMEGPSRHRGSGCRHRRRLLAVALASLELHGVDHVVGVAVLVPGRAHRLAVSGRVRGSEPSLRACPGRSRPHDARRPPPAAQSPVPGLLSAMSGPRSIETPTSATRRATGPGRASDDDGPSRHPTPPGRAGRSPI